MPLAKKVITKTQIVNAFERGIVKSNMMAARYFGCSYQHYRKYAKIYKDENGVDLLTKYKNQSGKGIPKMGKNMKNLKAIQDLIEGKIEASTFKNVTNIKDALITGFHLIEECSKCGFNDRRVVDSRVPLILNFKDNDKTNFKLDNLEFLCYNCYFLYVGDVWNDKELASLESYNTFVSKEDVADFELSTSDINRLKELGLWDEDDGEDFLDILVSN